MTIKYVSVLPAKRLRSKCYLEGRLPQSERVPDSEGMAAAGWTTLHHSTEPDIRHGSTANLNAGEYMRRLNKMFNTMKAVDPAQVPVTSRGRDGTDIRETDDYKALIAMPVTAHDSEQEKRMGWSAIDAGSADKAKKLQARVNVIAKAGAGTFKTKLPAGSTTLYIKRVSEEYARQRGEG